MSIRPPVDLSSVTSALAGKQPLDSDLTAIAALTTTSFGRALLALADAGAGRTAFGLGTAATHAHGDYDAAGAAAAAQAASQPLDSDLTAIAALSTTSFGRSLLALADAAAARTAIAAVSDTAYDATSWNGVTDVAPSKNAVRDQFVAAAATSVTPADLAAALPWRVQFDLRCAVPAVATGTWVISRDTTVIYDGYLEQSPVAQNNSLTWDVVLGAGTWALDVVYLKTSNAGIMKWALDDGASVFTDIGTIDGYAAAPALDQRATIASIAVASAIRRRLRVLMDTKHASSSSYAAFIESIQLRRTA